jgi:hypothetical protein
MEGFLCFSLSFLKYNETSNILDFFSFFFEVFGLSWKSF